MRSVAGRPGVRGGSPTRGFPPGSAQALVALVLGAVAVVLLEGGGISCYEVCSPTQEVLARAAPWPMITALVLAVLAGLVAAWPLRDG